MSVSVLKDDPASFCSCSPTRLGSGGNVTTKRALADGAISESVMSERRVKKADEAWTILWLPVRRGPTLQG